MSDEQELAQLLLAALERRGWRLAVAESCTGGELTAALTSVAGASRTVWGAAVVYGAAAKSELAGVPLELVERHGAVSGEVTRALSEGVRSRAKVELGLAVTGWAGPEGDGPDPVGTVYLGVASAADTRVERKHWIGARAEVRRRAVEAAMRMALQRVEES